MPDRSNSLAQRHALQERVRARRELRLFMRRLGILLVALTVLVLAGTVGFALTESTSVPYGFVRTVDTVTTVGAIPEPHDIAGRALKVALELLGVGALFYGLVTVAEFFVSGQLTGVLEERRTWRMIDSYTDHYIICGFGRVGRQVAHDLVRAGAPLVVIDVNPENRESARELEVPYIEDEAADDEVLGRAGIKRAKALIACVDSDAENIFITLTARELRADMLIIARASAEESEKKLLRAGADRVISPYKTSGTEMARMALHPQVGGGFDAADYRMEEIEVMAQCQAVGQTIGQVPGGSVVVAIRHQAGELEPRPAPDTVISAGDRLVAIGPPDALERLEEHLTPHARDRPVREKASPSRPSSR